MICILLCPCINFYDLHIIFIDPLVLHFLCILCTKLKFGWCIFFSLYILICGNEKNVLGISNVKFNA